jgi:hypothetical protein
LSHVLVPVYATCECEDGRRLSGTWWAIKEEMGQSLIKLAVFREKRSRSYI